MIPAHRFSFRITVWLCAVLSGVLFFSYRLTEQKRAADFALLAQSVRELDKSSREKLAFVVKDLDDPRRVISLNQDEPMAAASLLKLPIMVAAFMALDEGKISFSREVVITRKDITGGSGEIKAMKLPLRIKLGELVRLMITRSDNTATNKIIEILGSEYINRSFIEMGLEVTRLNRRMMDFSLRKKGIENYTTASETAFLLEKIARKKMIDVLSSEAMLALLKQQTVKDRLTRYLPQEVTVAHKTGLEKGVVHDAGIVFSDRGRYIICVLTKDVSSYAHAKKVIGRASLMTYSMYQ